MSQISDEKILEKEIAQLDESKIGIQKNIIKLTKFEYKIEITIPSNLTECPYNIELLLLIQKGFPKNPPKLFFKTNFTFPNLCDGRDFIEDVLGNSWSKDISLENIIGKIPHFIICYIQEIKEGFFTLSGKYYLGEKYDLNFIEKLPIYSKRLKQRDNLGNKIIESNKLLMISDLYFCVFDIDNKNRNSGILSFYSNMKGLITIKRIIHENSIIFVWRNKLSFQKHYELNLVVPNNSEEIVHLILGKMDSFGINYNINRRNLEPKLGTIPNCDIETVEKKIEEIENKIREDNINDTNLEDIQFLMSLYERAIEYYSAINNNRFEVINAKLQNLLKSKKINEFIDLNKNNGIINEEKKETKNKEIKEEEKKEKEKKEEDNKEEGNKKEEMKKEKNKEEIMKKEENKKEENKEENKKEENKEENKKEENKEENKKEETNKEEIKKEEMKKEEIKKEENIKEENKVENKEKKMIENQNKDFLGSSLSERDKLKKSQEEKVKEPPKTSRTLHVTLSNEDDDVPIDIGSDDDEEEDES